MGPVLAHKRKDVSSASDLVIVPSISDITIFVHPKENASRDPA